MHSFLITGATDEKRNRWIEEKLKEWKVGKFDRVEISPAENSIGIADVRDFQSKLFLKPYQSQFTVGIIHQADLLTTEAQNALLKTLEEPPPHVKLILEAQTDGAFLPTVLSRCQIINLGQAHQYTAEEKSSYINILKFLATASIGNRLKKIDDLVKTRDDATAFIDLAIATGRDDIFANSLLLRKLLNGRRELSSNVNYKLVLDNVFL